MRKQIKKWGYTQLLFSNDSTSVCRIFVVAGGECSKHLHSHKYNMFFIESGSLRVIDYDSKNEIVISKGDHLTIPPGRTHKFVAEEDTVAYEIYWSRCAEEDIIRFVSE